MSDFGSPTDPFQPPAGQPPIQPPPPSPPQNPPPDGLRPPTTANDQFGENPPFPQSNPGGLQPPLPAGPGDGPGYVGYPGTAPKKRRIWLWILGVILLAMVGMGACTYALFRAVKPAIDTTNAMAAAIADRDFDQAAELASTSPDCFGESVETSLRDLFADTQLESYTFTSSSVSTSNGVSTAEVSGSVTIAGDTRDPAITRLIKEGDDWKVCGLQW